MNGCTGFLAIIVCVGWAVRAPAGETIALSDCLVIKPVGRYGRAALHTDAIEAEIVAGRWKAPQAGDKVMLPNGTEQKWESATAKDGALDHPALAAGDFYWKGEGA